MKNKNLEDIDTINTPLATPPFKFDPDDHRHHLKDDRLSEEQQNEILQALWHIMSIFVDIGWGVDTVQILLPQLLENTGADSEKLLVSNIASEFNQVVSETEGSVND